MGLLDMFRSPTEKKRAEEKRLTDDLAPEVIETSAEREGPGAALPAAQREALSAPSGMKVRRAGMKAEPKLLSETTARRGAVIVRAPDGIVAGHPWQPLRPESLLPLFITPTESGTDAGRLFLDETGTLLRHISPAYACEDRLHYELDDRFYTTLVVRSWPRDDPRPSLWVPFMIELQQRVPIFSISMHNWRIGATAGARELKLQIDKRQLELDQLIEKAGTEDQAVFKISEQIATMRDKLHGLIRQQLSLFHVSCYIRVGADSREELRERVREVEEVARGKGMGVTLMAAPGEQRDAYISSMPFSSDPAYYTALRGSDAAAALLPLISRDHIERNMGKNPVVLYGLHMANYTPVLMSPFNANETIEVTTVLGRMGSGKSYWLRCHLGRLAMVGVQTITIDPLGDFVSWHTKNEATIIEIAPDSDFHINPFKRVWSEVDGEMEPVAGKIQRLMPMFQLILAEKYDIIARGLLEGALREFYERFGDEERLMEDFLAVLRDFHRHSAGEFSEATVRQRQDLIDVLALRCLEGQYEPFFIHQTNIDIDPRSPRSRKILFNLAQSGGGDLMVFAAFMAMTMATNIAQSSTDRKILLIDELHLLFRAANMAAGIGEMLAAFARIHRHWNVALTFGTQWVDEDAANTAQEGILKATGTWVLLRATEKMLEQTSRLISSNVDPELLKEALQVSAASAEEQRRSAKPMIVVRNNEAVPMLSIGLSFEEAEDDKASGVRIKERP